MTPKSTVLARRWASCRVSVTVTAAHATCLTGPLICSLCCMAIPGRKSRSRPKRCGLCWVVPAAITVFFTAHAFLKRPACAWPDDPEPENAPSLGGKHVPCYPLYQDPDGADAAGAGAQASWPGSDLEPDPPLQSHLQALLHHVCRYRFCG